MKILICVYYNAPLGGLQANILSTALYCKRMGHEVTVLCKRGPFNDQLNELGIGTFTTDYSSTDATVEEFLLARGGERYDIIHTHPFASRKVAQALASHFKAPLVITYHGTYHDEIAAHVGDYAAVLTVSEGIKDYLATMSPAVREKSLVAPNGVNRALFRPVTGGDPGRNEKRGGQILLVTRLDVDKRFIVEIFYKGLRYTAARHPEVRWKVVGDGSLADEVKRESALITGDADSVEFVGWQEGSDLCASYHGADVVLAPGRCALESMACGKATIAIGSKGYVGLITKESWMKGVYSNFGGVGAQSEGYREGAVEDDLGKVIDDERYRTQLGALGLDLTRNFYDEDAINGRILGLYALCSNLYN